MRKSWIEKNHPNWISKYIQFWWVGVSVLFYLLSRGRRGKPQGNKTSSWLQYFLNRSWWTILPMLFSAKISFWFQWYNCIYPVLLIEQSIAVREINQRTVQKTCIQVTTWLLVARRKFYYSFLECIYISWLTRLHLLLLIVTWMVYQLTSMFLSVLLVTVHNHMSHMTRKQQWQCVILSSWYSATILDSDCYY